MPPKTAAYYKKQKEREKKKRAKENAEIDAEHAAHGDPNVKKKKERVAVNALLEKLGRNEVAIPGDGNCLFSSLLHQLQLVGTPATGVSVSTPMEVRGVIADYMMKHQDDFLPFLDEEEGKEFGKYCERLRVAPEHWGTMLEAKAASDVFKVRLVVVTETGLRVIGSNEDSEVVGSGDWCITFLERAFALGSHFNSTTSQALKTAAASGGADETIAE